MWTAGTSSTGRPKASPAASTPAGTAVERSPGVDGNRCGISRHQPRDIVQLCRVVCSDVDAGGHHQLAPGQIRRGVGELDRVRPGDLTIRGALPGDQGQAKALDFGQAPRSDRHGAMLPAARRSRRDCSAASTNARNSRSRSASCVVVLGSAIARRDTSSRDPISRCGKSNAPASGVNWARWGSTSSSTSKSMSSPTADPPPLANPGFCQTRSGSGGDSSADLPARSRELGWQRERLRHRRCTGHRSYESDSPTTSLKRKRSVAVPPLPPRRRGRPRSTQVWPASIVSARREVWAQMRTHVCMQ